MSAKNTERSVKVDKKNTKISHTNSEKKIDSVVIKIDNRPAQLPRNKSYQSRAERQKDRKRFFTGQYPLPRKKSAQPLGNLYVV